MRMEKFAARARAYICTYHHLDQRLQALNSAACNDDTTIGESVISILPNQQELLYNEIEKLMKDFKGHRCALDFDSAFVTSQLKQETNQ